MDPPRSSTKLFTAGCTGRDPMALLDLLSTAGVRTVVDVRPQSGEDDFRALLASRGIAYRPLPALSNLFWECDDWRSRYTQFLGQVGELMATKLGGLDAPLCLLGTEPRAADCHRGLIAEFLASRGHEIEHLDAV